MSRKYGSQDAGPSAIRNRLAARDWFSLAEIRRWIAVEDDLRLWTAVSKVFQTGFRRIRPEPDVNETCEFMTRYLLRCIHEDVTGDDDVPSGYDAAYDLAAYLKFWAGKLPETHAALTNSARSITEALLRAGHSARDRLLNGTLEHALEAAAVRPFFQHWEQNPELSEPWREAMRWAVAHGDA